MAEPAPHEHEHSVYTRCWDCHSWGVNLPGSAACGNCGSANTTEYRPPCCWR